MRRRCHRGHLLPILFLGLFLLLFNSQTAQANDLVFQLNNQGLTFLSENQFHLGPVTLFLSPWIFTQLESELVETNFGLKEGGLDLAIGNFHLTIGRQLNTFGPGRYAFPLLAPLGDGLTAEGLDQVAYAFSTKRLAYKKLYAWVPVGDQFRLLLGQRATFDWGPFTFGFAETALARETAPNFYYLPLPLVPVGVYQLIAEQHLKIPEAEGALNLLAELDLTLRLGPNFKVYGGYLIDERPLPAWLEGITGGEAPAAGEKPWKVGYQVGGEWNRPLGINGLSFYTEYTRINRYTYTAEDPFFTYTYKGKLLGGPLGPDSDLLNLELVTTGNEIWTFALAYNRKRQGEGRIGDQWSGQPGQAEVFLTGTVETTDQLALTATKRMGLTDQVTLTLSLARITNNDHQPGAVALRPEIALSAQVSW